MNIWIKTKFDGVYIHAPSHQKKWAAKYYFSVQWRGKQVWRGAFTTPAQARDARVRMKADLMNTDGKIETRRMPVDSFQKMIDDLVKSGDIRKTTSATDRPRYSVLYSNGTDYTLFGMCIEYLAKHNRKHFADAVSIADFAEWMRQSGRSERTLEMCLRLLWVVYGLAVSRGLYKINPVLMAKGNEVLAARIRKRSQARKNPAMRKLLTPEDKNKICDVVKSWRDPRAVWVALNVWMGFRPSVFNRLRFEDFVPSKGLVFIRPEVHKSRLYKESGEPTPSFLPSFLPAEAYPILRQYAERIGLQFDNLRGFIDASGQSHKGLFLQRPIGHSGMRRVWRNILAQAGVEYASPYAARHTMINEMLSAGVAIKDVATHSGNTPETIYKSYVKPSTEKQIQTIPEKLRVWRAA